MPNAMYGISRFEDAVALLDAKDAEIARLRKAVAALLRSIGRADAAVQIELGAQIDVAEAAMAVTPKPAL